MSIIPFGHAGSSGSAGAGYRVVCNRDESRTRAPAAAPKWRAAGEGGARALWPMDLEAGGTWIAASDRGLCLCLLNLNLDPAPSAPTRARSRGLVIPELIDSADARAAVDRLSGMKLQRFAPFRLVAVGADLGLGVAEVRWDRSDVSVVWHHEPPICFASSGLGDALVSPRLELFEELVVGRGGGAERQDEFHRHCWPGRGETSVLMSREDARTVSITTLEVAPALDAGGERPGVGMRYEPLPEAIAVRTGATGGLARALRR